MNFTACIVCSAAEVHGNLLFVLGGGINRVNISREALEQQSARASEAGLPLDRLGHPIKVGICAQIAADDVDLIHEINVSVTDPQTAEVLTRVTVAVQVAGGSRFPGEPASVAVAATVLIPVALARPLDIRVSGDRNAGSILNTIYVVHTEIEDS